MVEQKPNVGVNKNADNLLQKKSPTFKIVDSPCKQDAWVCELKNSIESLLPNKRLEVSNEDTGINMNDFKTKVRNIVFAHQRKFVDKQFTTEQINKTTIAIDRQK